MYFSYNRRNKETSRDPDNQDVRGEMRRVKMSRASTEARTSEFIEYQFNNHALETYNRTRKTLLYCVKVFVYTNVHE